MEQNGGVRGGWDEYDHQTFLKFRNRYQVCQTDINLCEFLFMIFEIV